MAVVVVVVVVVAMALLVRSCDTSATLNSLKNYNAAVYSLIQRSDSNGQAVLHTLEVDSLTSSATANALTADVSAAQAQLQNAQSLRAPTQMSSAESALVYVMRLRASALQTIATHFQQAASISTSAAAVYEISLGTSELYASDVVYKTFVTTGIARALNASGIPIGTASGGEQQINSGQVLPDLGWLQETWIANAIGAHLSTAAANANNNQPGNHGHRLNYVTVDGTAIYSTGTNTIPRNASQVWTLNLTNDGAFPEYDVGCSVRIVGLNDNGTATLLETTPGETTNCVVHLPAPPTPGNYSVIVKIAKVEGENDIKNNTATYSVSFS